MTALNTLDDWVQHITKSELPTFGQTLAQIAAINEFMLSHAAELTRIVLRDPGMTARVLRLVNTVYFNPTRRRISTVSRAVIVLGFKTLRSLCVASLLLDELLARGGKELSIEIARAFHAAIQARELARMVNERNIEEIFIAALLYRIGELTFWICGGQSAQDISALMKEGKSASEAEEQVLGFRLRLLTQELVREWHINDTLMTAMQDRSESTPARCVHFADEIAHPPTSGKKPGRLPADLLQRLTTFTGRPADELRQSCLQARHGAVDALKSCGVPELANLLSNWQLDEPEISADEPETELSAQPGEPDPLLQLAVVRELTSLAQTAGKVDVHLALQTVLEGLHRGAGLPRVLVALTNPSRTELNAKYVLEWPVGQLQSEFRFKLDKAPILQTVMADNAVLWAWRDADQHGFGVVLKKTGAADCVLGPLAVGGKTIGLFYADRRDTALSTADLDAFGLLINLARLCLQGVAGH